jgi:hypothetical protein
MTPSLTPTEYSSLTECTTEAGGRIHAEPSMGYSEEYTE